MLEYQTVLHFKSCYILLAIRDCVHVVKHGEDWTGLEKHGLSPGFGLDSTNIYKAESSRCYTNHGCFKSKYSFKANSYYLKL